MSEPNSRPLAIVRTYQEFIAALRARADQLDVSRETIDAISGLQPGYSAKLLASVPIRGLSKVSFGAMIGALGLKILLVEDVETLRRIEKRITKRRLKVNANQSMHTNSKRKRRGNPNFRNNPELQRILRMRGLANQSGAERSRIAQHAARHRWKRRKRQPRSNTADRTCCT